MTRKCGVSPVCNVPRVPVSVRTITVLLSRREPSVIVAPIARTLPPPIVLRCQCLVDVNLPAVLRRSFCSHGYARVTPTTRAAFPRIHDVSIEIDEVLCDSPRTRQVRGCRIGHARHVASPRW